MAYKISDECIMCGTCEGECPVGAIAEGEGKYEIEAQSTNNLFTASKRDCPRGQSFFLRFMFPFPWQSACGSLFLFT